MNKNIFISVAMIVVFAALVGGATLAWFTDATAPINNEFTAGTVLIEAEETVIPEVFMRENWNPGDCAEKEFTITNVGTKSIYLRAVIIGQWYNSDGSLFEHPGFEGENVRWDLNPEDQDWVRIGNNWYYKYRINGTYTGGSEPVTLKLKVCLSGPDTDNYFQGKVFKLITTFEAVQSSNGAYHDAWGDEYTFETGDPGDPNDPGDPGPVSSETAWIEGTNFGSSPLARYISYQKGSGTEQAPIVKELFAGADLNLVGYIKIWNDAATLYIKTETLNTIRIKEVHAYAGQNPPVESAPGQLGFNYNAVNPVVEYIQQTSYIFNNQTQKTQISFNGLSSGANMFITVHTTVLVPVS